MKVAQLPGPELAEDEEGTKTILHFEALPELEPAS